MLCYGKSAILDCHHGHQYSIPSCIVGLVRCLPLELKSKYQLIIITHAAQQCKSVTLHGFNLHHFTYICTYHEMLATTTTLDLIVHYLGPEKITWNSHNALLPMRYFVQVVKWVASDKPYLKCKIGTTSDNYSVFHH